MFIIKKRNNFIAGFSVVAIIALASIPAYAEQDSFATPEDAVDALVAANRSDNKAELIKVLGERADKLISSGDEIADKEGREKFVASYDYAHKLESDGNDKDILVIGEKEWPLPIPLVRENNAWHFDTDAGEQEILNRRIGRNELNAIEVCRSYVEAQREYAEQYNHYAKHFLSHSGKHDGLYWEVTDGEQESPLGKLVANAQAEGYTASKHHKPQPYQGYYYKILTAQSAQASGGAMNYISGNHMTKGFAVLAFPAKYGDSGIMSFIVNHNGIVHEKDLGDDTTKIANQIKSYDPDEGWKLTSK